jgi:hypothetical protein
MFGFNRSKESYVSSHVDYTYLAFGGRFGYHPDLGVKNLDAYGVITLGYYRRSWKSSLSGSSSFSSGTFLWGGAVGGRYFFTNNIGAFLELGYSALSFVTGGIAIKF